MSIFLYRRVAVRQDTCSIVALSLNMAQKVHPIIWSQSSLPYDCMQVQAVPKPIGEFITVIPANSDHIYVSLEQCFSLKYVLEEPVRKDHLLIKALFLVSLEWSVETL